MRGEDKKPKNDKKQTFHSKHVKHDPSAESARAKFGLNGPK